MEYYTCEVNEYIFTLYSDNNRTKIHKAFKFDIEHDCISTELHNIWSDTTEKYNTNLEAIKFICTQEIDDSVKFLKEEVIVNGFYIHKVGDLLEKLDAINENSPVFYYDESEYEIAYKDYIKFDSTQNIPLILEQLDMLIAELKEKWNNKDFIEDELKIDFENGGEPESNIGEDGEAEVFSILACLKYVFNYILQNPTAEFYYACQRNESFDTYEELSEKVESLFK